MPFTVKLNGYDVVADTADEVRALLGVIVPPRAVVPGPAPAAPEGAPPQGQRDLGAPASGRAGKRTTGHVSPNGRGFRWQFSLNGRRFTGPTVPTREEAEIGLRHALSGQGVAPEPRGCVQRNGNGFRWMIQHQGKRYVGPTGDTAEDAEELRAAAVAELIAGREPAVAPKYRTRAQREAARQPIAAPLPQEEPDTAPLAADEPQIKTCRTCGERGHNARRHKASPSKAEDGDPPPAADAFPDASILGDIAEIEQAMFDRSRLKAPLIRLDDPAEHPVIVATATGERVGLEIGADANEVSVRWLTSPGAWAPDVERVPRASVLRDATLEEQGLPVPDDVDEAA